MTRRTSSYFAEAGPTRAHVTPTASILSPYDPCTVHRRSLFPFLPPLAFSLSGAPAPLSTPAATTTTDVDIAASSAAADTAADADADAAKLPPRR